MNGYDTKLNSGEKRIRNTQNYINKILTFLCNTSVTDIGPITEIVRMETCGLKPTKKQINEIVSRGVNLCRDLKKLKYSDFENASKGEYGYTFISYIGDKKVRVKVPLIRKVEFVGHPSQYYLPFVTENYAHFKEIYNGLMYFNRLAKEIPTFIITYGMWLCDNNKRCINKDMKKSDVKNLTESNFLLLIEQVDSVVSTFVDVKLSSRKSIKEFLELCIQAVVALQLLRDRFNVDHCDCHFGNILIQDVGSTVKDWKVRVWGKEITLRPSNGKITRVIDYGLSSGSWKNNKDYNTNVNPNFYDEKSNGLISYHEIKDEQIFAESMVYIFNKYKLSYYSKLFTTLQNSINCSWERIYNAISTELSKNVF